MKMQQQKCQNSEEVKTLISKEKMEEIINSQPKISSEDALKAMEDHMGRKTFKVNRF